MRRAAADALATARDAGAARALGAALADRDQPVRAAASRALVQIGPGAAGPVIDLLDDESKEVASAARAVLHEIGESRVIAHLVATMTEGGSRRHEAARLEAVGTADDIDRARLVLATLESAVRHLARRIDPPTLAAVASMFDIVRLSPASARARDITDTVEERVSLAALRAAAATELTRRGIEAPAG